MKTSTKIGIGVGAYLGLAWFDKNVLQIGLGQLNIFRVLEERKGSVGAINHGAYLRDTGLRPPKVYRKVEPSTQAYQPHNESPLGYGDRVSPYGRSAAAATSQQSNEFLRFGDCVRRSSTGSYGRVIDLKVGKFSTPVISFIQALKQQAQVVVAFDNGDTVVFGGPNIPSFLTRVPQSQCKPSEIPFKGANINVELE